MTLAVVFGCSMITFSFPLAVFAMWIRKSPELVILMISSGFLWLLSILISSGLWFAVSPWKDDFYWSVCVSVFFQEISRVIFFLIVWKAEKGLASVGSIKLDTMAKQKFAFVGGLGVGSMGAIFLLESVLGEAGGPGTIQSPGCTNISFFVISCFIGCAFVYLHTFWMVIAMDGFFYKRYWQSLLVVALHFGSSLLTVANAEGLDCAVSLAPLFAEVLLTGGMSYYVTKRAHDRPQATAVN